MRRIPVALLIAFVALGCSKKDDEEPKAKPVVDPPKVVVDYAAKAKQLAKKYPIVDGHVDIPYRLQESKDDKGQITEDISRRTEKGDFDYVRARQGGLDAPFMSIYIPADKQKEKGAAKKLANELIAMVEDFAIQWPDKFAMAVSPADVETNTRAGLISLPMGIENGAAIEDDLANVAHFHKQGIRYITLTHSKDNLICDSSYDETRTWKGLSPFGRKVVEEMNRVGIMVDISHVSDDTFHQVIELTKVPVIASHSSARHFIPGFERNMDDDMIKKLAANGGVMLINFGSGFVKKESHEQFGAYRKAKKAFQEENKLADDDPKLKEFPKTYFAKNPPAFADVSDVADHIDHVVKLTGSKDHVGFGSDFDGVGESLPIGLKDVSFYPNLIRVLLERGYTEKDVKKIMGGNFLRVWKAVEDYAAKQKS